MTARKLSIFATLIVLALCAVGCEGRGLSMRLGLAKAGTIVLTDVVLIDLTDDELDKLIEQTSRALDISTTIDQTLRTVHDNALAERDRRAKLRNLPTA